METPFDIYLVSDIDDIYEIPEICGMYSQFNTSPNITKENLLHLLSGKPLVDLSDDTFIHPFQLDEDALTYVKEHFHT